MEKETFWANTNEEQLASEGLFSELKEKFASTKKNTDVVDGGAAKKMDKKKTKKPVVLQDEKILQALCKASFSFLRNLW